jgi:single-stranded DNA-binding protein
MNNEIAAVVCTRLAEGESLRKAAEAEGTTHSTILAWVKEDAEFANQYARAREIGYHLLADEIVEISDESQRDSYTDEQGNVRVNAEVVARSRLRVDTRKWMLSKMLPKVYGEKLELKGDPENPVHMVTRRIIDTRGGG